MKNKQNLFLDENIFIIIYYTIVTTHFARSELKLFSIYVQRGQN